MPLNANEISTALFDYDAVAVEVIGYDVEQTDLTHAIVDPSRAFQLRLINRTDRRSDKPRDFSVECRFRGETYRIPNIEAGTEMTMPAQFQLGDEAEARLEVGFEGTGQKWPLYIDLARSHHPDSIVI